MFIVHVHVHVKPEYVEAFRQATVENARNSVREPGVARFDVIQQMDDPTRFVLVEVYRTPEDAGRHKETAHYQVWRDTVEPMMAEPRSSVKYANVFPGEQGQPFVAAQVDCPTVRAGSVEPARGEGESRGYREGYLVETAIVV